MKHTCPHIYTRIIIVVVIVVSGCCWWAQSVVVFHFPGVWSKHDLATICAGVLYWFDYTVFVYLYSDSGVLSVSVCPSCRYQTEFGFTLADREICVDDIRVRGTGRGISPTEPEFPTDLSDPLRIKVTQCYFDTQYYDTPIYTLSSLKPGQVVVGPAIIIDKSRYGAQQVPLTIQIMQLSLSFTIKCISKAI